MKTDYATYTIGDYIRGKVRGITVPDEALLSICTDAGTDPCSLFCDVQEKERELSCAWLYMWIAGGPTRTGSVSDEDADWKHTEGGESMSAETIRRYLAMADEIFDKYDMPLTGSEDWGFVGRGIHNPRKY